MRRLMALDQATRVTGISIFIDGKLEHYGKIDLKVDDLGERLVQLRLTLVNYIQKYQINEVAFEDIQLQSSVGNNVQTFKALASVWGLVLELCEELRLPYTIVSAATWKSTLKIGGKKRAEQKANAQKYVEENYNIKATQDECDSICIGTHILISTEQNSAW